MSDCLNYRDEGLVCLKGDGHDGPCGGHQPGCENGFGCGCPNAVPAPRDPEVVAPPGMTSGASVAGDPARIPTDADEGVKCRRCGRWHSGVNTSDERTDLCEDCDPPRVFGGGGELRATARQEVQCPNCRGVKAREAKLCRTCERSDLSGVAGATEPTLCEKIGEHVWTLSTAFKGGTACVCGQMRGAASPVSSDTSAETEYEYRTTKGPRKAWDGEPDLTKEGWELDPDRGRPGESWERFDYHEEMYWRRKKTVGSGRVDDVTNGDKP